MLECSECYGEKQGREVEFSMLREEGEVANVS